MSEKEKKSAWDFAFALIKFDNLEPSKEMIEWSQQEIQGNITLKQIYQALIKKYGVSSKA
ncbi:MAG: antitoxin VbhA family protein [Oscillospiraceae bacterium]|nr:antitoxin VbhA family protein [Oscillospiraceae bacterium]